MNGEQNINNTEFQKESHNKTPQSGKNINLTFNIEKSFSVLENGVGYISGPMSGKDNHNFEEFNQTASVLRDGGLTISNPAENIGGSKNQSREWFMRLDLQKVMVCNYIVLLDGWDNSLGAKMEVIVADQLGKPIFKLQHGLNNSEYILKEMTIHGFDIASELANSYAIIPLE